MNLWLQVGCDKDSGRCDCGTGTRLRSHALQILGRFHAFLGELNSEYPSYV